ncbi:DUF397 domain-containing protein [Streptomyces europaeiscabiei]|uniref:DUF397 domain-containing protein n=1 Tax=Streptomyces europaeiscabiei TaxID=146819 RepID=UPI0029BFD64E|nr:DUF397 domain-containing protein [Streptomyces europaeiscabiei]
MLPSTSSAISPRNCERPPVSLTLHWQKSSFSAGDADNACLEIATAPTAIQIRESDHPTTILTPSPTALYSLLTALKGSRR